MIISERAWIEVFSPVFCVVVSCGEWCIIKLSGRGADSVFQGRQDGADFPTLDGLSLSGSARYELAEVSIQRLSQMSLHTATVLS